MILTKFYFRYKLLSVLGWFPLLRIFNRLGASILLAFILPIHCAFAQITSDGTLVNNSTIKIEGNTSIIEGGTQAGSNLFHSFQEFSVPTGRTAYFNNALDIQNIFSRITGQSGSNIDGLIRANGQANLFLINPNGIIFGPNASLNIGGSFLASTASTVKFLDGKEFSTTVSQATPLLTISTPIGLQFGGNLGTVENQSVVTNSSGKIVGLQVQPERTLALVGGNIKLDGGSLQAPNGRVELAAVAPQGTIGLSVSGNNMFLQQSPDYNKADISLTNAAQIDVIGKGRGSVDINARNLEISGGSQISAGIGQGLIAENSPPGNIALNALGEVKINYPSRLTNIVAREAIGKSGDIIINAGTINIDNRNINNWASPTTQSFIPSALETGVLGKGYAGNISLFATNSINLIGQDINAQDRVISTLPFEKFSKGRYYRQQLGGGDITLETHGSISLNNAFLNATGGYGGNISIIGNQSVSITENSFINGGTGTGDSKNITVQSNGRVTIQRSFLGNGVGGNPSGNGGDINIKGQSIFITDGSYLEATTSQMGGNSGNIRINAVEKVEISGVDIKNGEPGDRFPRYHNTVSNNTVLTTRAWEETKGKAGDITINASEIYINNQGTALEDRSLPPALDAGSYGEGSSGNVSLFATGSITLIGQDKKPDDQVISTYGKYPSGGGHITLTSGGSISLQNAYLISARANGGDISLSGDASVSITEKSFLNAGSTQGNSGAIKINSNGPVTIQTSWLGNNVGSTEQAGNAGKIEISGQSIFITDGSLIETRSENIGENSGNIWINAKDQVVVSGKNPFADGDKNNTRAGIIQKIINPYTTVTTNLEPGSRGRSGEIRIHARSLEVSDGASLRAISQNASEGGNITVRSEQLRLTNGGQLITDARNSGNAGNINLIVGDRIIIDGNNLSVNNVLTPIAQESGEERTEDTSTSGIFANAESGTGGNINIEAKNLLLLRRGAQIKAVANNGNGGNIIIKTKRGFIVAIPNQNSDITANALNGNGGKVTINATGIFGMIPRSREDLVKLLGTSDPKKLDPAQLLTNDISAISQANPLLNGVVTINTPDVDPTKGFVELPANLVDASQQIATGCTPKNGQNSRFVATGRGGLPLNPSEPLRSRLLMTQWVTVDEQVQNAEDETVKTLSLSEHPADDFQPIVEAQSLVVDKRGDIHLVAQVADAISSLPTISSVACKTSH